jgi:hypothetical protein
MRRAARWDLLVGQKALKMDPVTAWCSGDRQRRGTRPWAKPFCRVWFKLRPEHIAKA